MILHEALQVFGAKAPARPDLPLVLGLLNFQETDEADFTPNVEELLATVVPVFDRRLGRLHVLLDQLENVFVPHEEEVVLVGLQDDLPRLHHVLERQWKHLPPDVVEVLEYLVDVLLNVATLVLTLLLNVLRQLLDQRVLLLVGLLLVVQVGEQTVEVEVLRPRLVEEQVDLPELGQLVVLQHVRQSEPNVVDNGVLEQESRFEVDVQDVPEGEEVNTVVNVFELIPLDPDDLLQLLHGHIHALVDPPDPATSLYRLVNRD